MTMHICPWWIGYLLASPLRYLFQDPYKIFTPYIKEGMKMVDIGSGMGYFSLPLARMVGDTGKVICVDIQKQMLNNLKKKAKRLNLLSRIEPVLCNSNSLCIEKWDNDVDFAIAFAVIHEMPDKKNTFNQIYKVLKNKKGILLFAEPRGHVSINNFNESLKIVEEVEFKKIKTIDINKTHSVILSG